MTTMIESNNLGNNFDDTAILLESIESEKFPYKDSHETQESGLEHDSNETQESGLEHDSHETQESGVAQESDMGQACPICFEDSTNMIIFECNHTICIECLEKIFWSQGKSNILCPICRHIVELSSNSVPEATQIITNHVHAYSPCIMLNFIVLLLYILHY